MARKESPEALLVLTDQLSQIRSVGVTAWPALADVHPATRRLLAGWGYRYNVWHLRRFSAAKRNAVVICFLRAARAETTDAIIDMQDKLITSIHNKARKRYDGLLHAAEEARSRAVEVVEELGTLVLNDSIPDIWSRCSKRNYHRKPTSLRSAEASFRESTVFGFTAPAIPCRPRWWTTPSTRSGGNVRQGFLETSPGEDFP